MILSCPHCKQPNEILDSKQSAWKCPHCGEAIDVPRLQESTCPICCGEFGSEDSLVICPDCKSVYHTECWEENHGCSTYGCSSTKHLETHNAAEADSGTGMVYCPFCGAAHAGSDLVCPSCGHLLQEGAVNTGDISPSAQGRGGGCLPKLGRNFGLLMKDVKSIVSLAWKAYSKYADFKGKSSRSEYLAFVGVFSLLSVLLHRVVVFGFFWPVSLVPIFAITARRLRDTGLSPWMMFAIPILPLLLLVPSVEEPANSEVSE